MHQSARGLELDFRHECELHDEWLVSTQEEQQASLERLKVLQEQLAEMQRETDTLNDHLAANRAKRQTEQERLDAMQNKLDEDRKSNAEQRSDDDDDTHTLVGCAMLASCMPLRFVPLIFTAPPCSVTCLLLSIVVRDLTSAVTGAARVHARRLQENEVLHHHLEHMAADARRLEQRRQQYAQQENQRYETNTKEVQTEEI